MVAIFHVFFFCFFWWGFIVSQVVVFWISEKSTVTSHILKAVDDQLAGIQGQRVSKWPTWWAVCESLCLISFNKFLFLKEKTMEINQDNISGLPKPLSV